MANFEMATAEDILAYLPQMYFGTIQVKDEPFQTNSGKWKLEVVLTWLLTTAPGMRKNGRITWTLWEEHIATAIKIRELFNGRQGTVMVWGGRNEPYEGRDKVMVDKVVCDGMGFALFAFDRIDTLMRSFAVGADPALSVPVEVQPVALTPVDAPLVGNRNNAALAALAAQRPTPVARPVVPQVPRPRPQVPQIPR